MVNKFPHGQIRQSQLVTTFGPGAMMDLPNHAVLVGGLDDWKPLGDALSEPRLAEKVAQLLDVPAIQLRLPPRSSEDMGQTITGVTAWQFPEWRVTQDVSTDGSITRSRMLVHRKSLTKNKFIDIDRKSWSVVPIRFVRACRNGHIADIDWRSFAHSGQTDCTRQLWLDERGTSGDLTESFIRCECGIPPRTLVIAADLSNRALGTCTGSRPWLGPMTSESCGEPSRLLIRTASNAYFSQLMSVISLPERDEGVKERIDLIWDFLSEVDDIDALKYERKKAKVSAALEDLNNEEVFAEIQRRRGITRSVNKSVKQAELETLISAQDELGEDRPDGNFFARALPKDAWVSKTMEPIERVVLIHRLREVIALVGFTRFEAAAPDAQGELEIGVRRAALAETMTWVPAIENKGEGIFLQFNPDVMDAWVARSEVLNRGRLLNEGFNEWKAERKASKREFLGLPYVMLHSFAHLLITSVSLECGYPASSIRERIYALPSIGYGILLYTGSTDAEGTLGGLIQVGRHIKEHVSRALELGELCSNDPVCAQHSPTNEHEKRYLHGAACHGCLLIAETSCEQHNEFLDRALVVPTLENLGIQFFNQRKT